MLNSLLKQQPCYNHLKNQLLPDSLCKTCVTVFKTLYFNTHVMISKFPHIAVSPKKILKAFNAMVELLISKSGVIVDPRVYVFHLKHFFGGEKRQ